MIDLQDIEIIEGETTATTQQYYETIQKAINTGLWGMQGSYGRTMMEAINKGHEAAELKKIAVNAGMKTLHQDSLLKVRDGLTTLAEAISSVSPDL